MSKGKWAIRHTSLSYALMIVLMTVGLAIILVALAYAFDTLVLDHEVPLPAGETVSDIIKGKAWK